MNEIDAWQAFFHSGSVYDYLVYKCQSVAVYGTERKGTAEVAAVYAEIDELTGASQVGVISKKL